ncbi:hypothetical protein [Glaciecola sp. KUL10]|uniref:hypothetical protein n=1 Tax=Glaciecola sp. (strain KUL10) TaxID=2161813 RepID=UPI000D782E4B|nr:hypothetical protein [Glaciecola sp. KUL10]GBL06005.1 PAS sensor protein [Glaciecola sp. KUL10]
MKTAEEQIRLLEMQLDRERRDRKRAEELLHAKSNEVVESSRFLSNMTERLRLAFWFENEIVWEYVVNEDAFYLFSSVDDKQATISATGNLDDAVNAYHREDQAMAQRQWQTLIETEAESFEFKARRYSPVHECYRWVNVRGRKVLDEKDGSLKKVVGLFNDIHERYLRNVSLKTISNAFLNTRHPGFIIDFAIPHVEVTDSFYAATGLDKNNCSVDFLLALLPLEVIKKHQVTGERFFVETLQISPEKSLRCEFGMAKLKQDKYNSKYYRYSVGFFRVKVS